MIFRKWENDPKTKTPWGITSNILRPIPTYVDGAGAKHITPLYQVEGPTGAGLLIDQAWAKEHLDGTVILKSDYWVHPGTMVGYYAFPEKRHHDWFVEWDYSPLFEARFAEGGKFPTRQAKRFWLADRLREYHSDWLDVYFAQWRAAD